MRTAEECLRHAVKCEAEAQATRDEINRFVLSAAAKQWRKLAEEADEHRKKTAILPT